MVNAKVLVCLVEDRLRKLSGDEVAQERVDCWNIPKALLLVHYVKIES